MYFLFQRCVTLIQRKIFVLLGALLLVTIIFLLMRQEQHSLKSNELSPGLGKIQVSYLLPHIRNIFRQDYFKSEVNASEF